MSPPMYHKKTGVVLGCLQIAFSIPTLLVIWTHIYFYGNVNPCHVVINGTCMKNITDLEWDDIKRENVTVVKHILYEEGTYDFIWRYDVGKIYVVFMLFAGVFAICAGIMHEGHRKCLLVATLVCSILSILVAIAMVGKSIEAITMYADPEEHSWTLKFTIMRIMVGVSVIQVFTAVAVTWVASFCCTHKLQCAASIFNQRCPYQNSSHEEVPMYVHTQRPSPSQPLADDTEETCHMNKHTRSPVEAPPFYPAALMESNNGAYEPPAPMNYNMDSNMTYPLVAPPYDDHRFEPPPAYDDIVGPPCGEA